MARENRRTRRETGTREKDGVERRDGDMMKKESGGVNKWSMQVGRTAQAERLTAAGGGGRRGRAGERGMLN